MIAVARPVANATQLLADLARAANGVIACFDDTPPPKPMDDDNNPPPEPPSPPRGSPGGLDEFAMKQGPKGGNYWLPDGAEDIPRNRKYGVAAQKAAASAQNRGQSQGPRPGPQPGQRPGPRQQQGPRRQQGPGQPARGVPAQAPVPNAPQPPNRNRPPLNPAIAAKVRAAAARSASHQPAIDLAHARHQPTPKERAYLDAQHATDTKRFGSRAADILHAASHAVRAGVHAALWIPKQLLLAKAPGHGPEGGFGRTAATPAKAPTAAPGKTVGDRFHGVLKAARPYVGAGASGLVQATNHVAGLYGGMTLGASLGSAAGPLGTVLGGAAGGLIGLAAMHFSGIPKAGGDYVERLLTGHTTNWSGVRNKTARVGKRFSEAAGVIDPVALVKARVAVMLSRAGIKADIPDELCRQVVTRAGGVA